MKDKKQLLDTIELIASRLFETRPKSNIFLRPYINPDFVTRKQESFVSVELSKLYPQARCGDYLYTAVDMKVSHNTVYALTFKGADRIWLNGEEVTIRDLSLPDGWQKVEINMRAGFNSLVFKCPVTKERFSLDYIVATVFYPHLWVSDYLHWCRDTIPVKEYADEQGFAVTELVKKGENKNFEDCEIIFPKPSVNDDVIDFKAIYSNANGEYAYALSFARTDGILDIKSDNELTIYINGKKTEDLKVSSGDCILIACKRDSKWGFECNSNDILYLPQVTSVRKNGVHWLLLGAMGTDDAIDVQFIKPYKNAEGEYTFWRFADRDTYLRPYLDSCFFGQWFYGLMIGEYGLLKASEYKKEYYEYFRDSMRILAEYYPYMQYDGALFGDTPFLKRCINIKALDPIGTIGMNLYELYIREKDETLKNDILYVLNCLADITLKKIPRMEDGTFYRIATMWLDDTYMSCPFLVRMGRLTGDTKYYDEVILQLKNYTKLLYIDKYNVYSHIYFPKDNKANEVPWGRGNGWVYLALVDVIEHLPEDYIGRDELIDIFRKAIGGLVKLQSESGLWNQVLTRPETYMETSCTALFAVAISKGIKLGILEKDVYLSVVEKAVNGIIDNSVAENGDVNGVCRGSGCCYDWEYYAQLEIVCGDDHGTGVVLAAICEYINLMEG